MIEVVEGDETKTLTPERVSEVRGTVAERLRRQLHGDLDNIVLLAMRKEPQRRYRTALQLAVYPLAIGGSLLLAMASWRWYEAPILALKRHFPRARGKESETRPG